VQDKGSYCNNTYIHSTHLPDHDFKHDTNDVLLISKGKKQLTSWEIFRMLTMDIGKDERNMGYAHLGEVQLHHATPVGRPPGHATQMHYSYIPVRTMKQAR
jgi:hypothetical protein